MGTEDIGVTIELWDGVLVQFTFDNVEFKLPIISLLLSVEFGDVKIENLLKGELLNETGGKITSELNFVKFSKKKWKFGFNFSSGISLDRTYLLY